MTSPSQMAPIIFTPFLMFCLGNITHYTQYNKIYMICVMPTPKIERVTTTRIRRRGYEERSYKYLSGGASWSRNERNELINEMSFT